MPPKYNETNVLPIFHFHQLPPMNRIWLINSSSILLIGAGTLNVGSFLWNQFYRNGKAKKENNLYIYCIYCLSRMHSNSLIEKWKWKEKSGSEKGYIFVIHLYTITIYYNESDIFVSSIYTDIFAIIFKYIIIKVYTLYWYIQIYLQ